MHNADKPTLSMVVAAYCAKMMALGMESRPFHREGDYELMLESWQDALEDAGYRDADAPRLAKCWRAMLRTQSKWFRPAELIQSARSLPRQDSTPRLPKISDEDFEANLKKLRALCNDSGIKLVSHE